MRVVGLTIGLIWVATAGAEVLYRLPWPDGSSFMFTQVYGGRITTHFARSTLHAVDIAMPQGTPVLAARAGIVETLQADHGATEDEAPLTYEGNFVAVRHADGTVATYAHLKHRGLTVGVGEAIEAGQLLGVSGASGDVLEPHLHFVVTRVHENSSGWREEVSIPVKFYVGAPPLAFAPRAALIATADYSPRAEAPRTPSEGGSLAPWKPPASDPGAEAGAWGLLALWLAAGFAGLAWFWRFASR